MKCLGKTNRPLDHYAELGNPKAEDDKKKNLTSPTSNEDRFSMET